MICHRRTRDGTLSNWRSQTLIRRCSVFFHRQRWPASNSKWSSMTISLFLATSLVDAAGSFGQAARRTNKICFMLLVRKTRFLIRPACNGSYFNLKFRQIPEKKIIFEKFHEATHMNTRQRLIERRELRALLTFPVNSTCFLTNRIIPHDMSNGRERSYWNSLKYPLQEDI